MTYPRGGFSPLSISAFLLPLFISIVIVVIFIVPLSLQVLGWVSEGVRDFSISRAAVSWGIPVPDMPEQTIYVWFDALLG